MNHSARRRPANVRSAARRRPRNRAHALQADSNNEMKEDMYGH